MQFKATIHVRAAKRFKDTIDGKAYDSTTIYYDVSMANTDDSLGQVTEPIKWGLASNLEKLRGLEFPFMADVVLEQISNGKTSTLIIHDLVPVKSAPNQTTKSA